MAVLRWLLAAWLVLAFALPAVAQAQSPPEPGAWSRPAQNLPDYPVWESVASRAEEAIDAREDSTEVFETLRSRIAGFRATFDTARNADAARIATLRSQIEALGPPPEEGQTEADDIAQRRAELNRQLNQALAPVQVAEEAYTRADGLIRQIDNIIRERQTERLLSLSPSPLNPVHWPQAAQETVEALAEIAAERGILQDPQRLADARQNLPVVLILFLLALVLLSRGRAWSKLLGERLRTLGGRGTGVWGFVVSLLRIALPLAGLYALTEAFYATGLAGRRVGAILDALPIWGAVLLGYRWLADRLFARSDDDAIVNLPLARRKSARFYVGIMALLLVLRAVVELLFDLSDFDRASRAVVAFPIVVMLSLVLFRIGALLRASAPQDAVDELDFPAVGQGVTRLVRWAGLVAQIVAVAATVMSAVGYSAFSNAMLYPMIMSLGLLGLVMTLQRFVSDIYGWASGQGNAARDSLLSVFMGLLLLLCAAPLLALIWGARVADLTELWTAFLGGIRLGETTISPTDFMVFVLVFAAGYVLTRLLQGALRTSVLPKTRIDPGGQNALVSGLGYVGIFLAGLLAITSAGLDLSSVALVAGALSVGIGFGLQNIVSNFVSGIILLIERPISAGDWIEVGGQHGVVRDISVRSTRIETFDRSDLIVPNSDLVSNTVTNYTKGNTVGRVIVQVHVAFGSDTRKVEEIMLEIAKAHPLVLLNPEPFVLFRNFGANAMNFEIRAILRDVNWVLNVQSDMNHEISERFAAEGIVIPIPQQDVWLRDRDDTEPERHRRDRKPAGDPQPGDTADPDA